MKINLAPVVSIPQAPSRSQDMPCLASKIEITRSNQPPQYFPAFWFANGDVVVLVQNNTLQEESVEYGVFLTNLLSNQALPPIEKATVMGVGLSHIQSPVVATSPNSDHTPVSTYLGVTQENNFLRPASHSWVW